MSLRSSMDRRQFLRNSSVALAFAATGIASAVETSKPVRIGIVGVGHRGSYLAELLAGMPGVEVPALCDINPETLTRSIATVQKISGKAPAGYSRGPKDYLRLVERSDLDAVISATPWDSLAPIMIAAMKAGKYAGMETGPAMSIDECWELVETFEKTKAPCMMLENVCFFRNVMMTLNMVQKGALGEMVHCAGGYQHDLRSDYLKPGASEPSWLGQFHVQQNASLYSVHALGPISQWLNITRGDRFDHLVSMSSKSAGMGDMIARRQGATGPKAMPSFKNGDVNVTLLRTRNGATATLYYDTQSPRAYDLGLRAQGTRGICMVADGKVFLEGRSKKIDEWESLKDYAGEFEHPVWKRAAARAKGSGHGGSDYLTLEAFVEAVRSRRQPPIDVYDSVTWRAVCSLSEKSVSNRSRPVDFPDFTKGRWRSRPPAAFA